jgi:hypothetical protein
LRGNERLGGVTLAITPPGDLHHDRQAVCDDVEKAPDAKPGQAADDEERCGPELEDLHVRLA